MAEINHTITLGIGTPGAIPEFLTFGLQIGSAILAPSAPEERTFLVFAENRTFEVWKENRTFEIGQENRTFEVKE